MPEAITDPNKKKSVDFYLNKWGDYFNNDENLIPPQYKNFYLFLRQTSSPLAKRVSTLLLNPNQEERSTYPYQLWLNNFEKLNSSFENIGRFFGELKEYYQTRLKGYNQVDQVDNLISFFNCWHNALCLTLAQTLTILTIFHDHLKEEPCNFFVGFLPCPFPKEKAKSDNLSSHESSKKEDQKDMKNSRRKRNPNQVYGEISSLYKNHKNIFNKYFPNGKGTINIMRNEQVTNMVYIPSCLTINEVVRYISLMEKFWQCLSEADFDTDWNQENGNIYSKSISPNVIMKVNLNEGKRQINLKGREEFEGISFRVDQEPNNQLSIDFGGDINYTTLLEISRIIGKINIEESYFHPPENIGELYSIIEKNKLLSNNQLIALVTAFGFQIFSYLQGTPYKFKTGNYQSFSYHLRPANLQMPPEEFEKILKIIVS